MSSSKAGGIFQREGPSSPRELSSERGRKEGGGEYVFPHGKRSYQWQHRPQTGVACLFAMCLYAQRYGSDDVFTHRRSHKYVHVFQLSRLHVSREYTSLYVYAYGGQRMAVDVDRVSH